LDPGKSIELSRNYIQISDGTGSKQGRFLKNRRACDFVAFFRFFSLAQAKKAMPEGRNPDKTYPKRPDKNREKWAFSWIRVPSELLGVLR
jgi:hypothetical protein